MCTPCMYSMKDPHQAERETIAISIPSSFSKESTAQLKLLSTLHYLLVTDLPTNTAHQTLQAGQCVPQSSLDDTPATSILDAALLKGLRRLLQLTAVLKASWPAGWLLLLLLLVWNVQALIVAAYDAVLYACVQCWV